MARRKAVFLLAALVFPILAWSEAPQRYFPGPRWEHRSAAALRIDAAKLQDVVDFARASESTQPRDQALAHYETFGREPFSEAIGPFKPRGDMTGVVAFRGYIVAEWGEPARVDMTYSVTKSLLSSVVGVAFDRGMIRSLDDPVRDYAGPIVAYRPAASDDKAARLGRAELLLPFESAHNRRITWDQLLRQTSDWEGTLWGKPDWADRPEGDPAQWATRPRHEPGTSWKYNDVRVNALALAALEVWRRPLPQVAKEFVMDPIGASNTWRWFGYENSFVVLDGTVMQSMTGGGHWGGGLFIDAYDMARFGYLTLNRGRWNGRQVLSEAWVARALTPTPVKPDYGFMNWFNNRDGKLLPSAPRSAFMHLGNGTNAIYVDPDHDLVAVLRWIRTPAIDGVVKRLIEALPKR